MDCKITCPLGSECETIVDNELHRCAWYIKVRGTDAQGEEHDEWGCAIAWQPILLLEVAGKVRQTNASIVSMRTSEDKNQRQALEVLKNVRISAP